MASVFKRGGKKTKGYYYASWSDHNGKRQTKCTRTTDKATAERIANKHETDAALRRDGVIDPALDAIGKESQRTIEAHLIDYESKLRAANRSDQYIQEMARCIREIAKAGEFENAAAINADAVTKFAGKLKDKGRSSRTIQAYLTAIKGFTRWLVSHHKLARDPLASVKKPNPKSDRRRERRMLLPEEWWRLEIATEAGPVRYGMAGSERLLLYRTAIQSGLRSNELRSLTRGRLYFDSLPPYITCKAGSTKNKKDARLYIQPELAAVLKAHIATKAPKSPVFNLPHESNLARMMRDDLAEARKQWLTEAKDNPQEYAQRQESDFLTQTNHEGETTDFHCLRHTCGAWLAMTGAHPKVVQQVMRHSTITLTMDTYGHLFPGQEADAVAQMRRMLTDYTLEELRATGTDDNCQLGTLDAQRLAQRAQCETRREDAKGCERQSNTEVQKKSPKPLLIANLGDVVRVGAPTCESAPTWSRTKNLLIKSQLLCRLSYRGKWGYFSIALVRIKPPSSPWAIAQISTISRDSGDKDLV